ncbi:hypothetical protein PybrP1_006278 [[Pythium] brassicae (nom. inval.)]|nr:hypothetical protein PybrP1_006278 [[Pythium] brassicae (nom. inval.)]
MTSTNADAAYHFRAASAAVINRILTRVCAESGLEQRFQSHSGRRGCASEALSHNEVSVAEVTNQGSWAFDAVSRVIMYFSGVDRGDMRVGRVVAGWTENDRGGVPFFVKSAGRSGLSRLVRRVRKQVVRETPLHLPLLSPGRSCRKRCWVLQRYLASGGAAPGTVYRLGIFSIMLSSVSGAPARSWLSGRMRCCNAG